MIFKILLFTIFIFITLSNADELKIGSVTEINGTIVAINDELEERDLLIHDPFFLNEEIFVTEGSSATIQFNDSTTVIMKELTSINVSEFENSKKNPKLKAELLKGKIIIETGSIAKKADGEMIVGVTSSSLGLRGTRIDVDLKPNGKSKISLAKDSFGNVGEIELTSEGKTSNITSTEQVLEVSENNETIYRNKTDDEKEEEKTVAETLIKSSKIDEEEITKQLQQKLENGNLQDANNDGIIDEGDVEIVKEQIADEKKDKIDFIVENSKVENTEFLSEIIDQSDEKNTGDVIDKIIQNKDNLVLDVVENLIDMDNEFLISSDLETSKEIKKKIFNNITSEENEKSIKVLSKVILKSDSDTISSALDSINEKSDNSESKLALKVLEELVEDEFFEQNIEIITTTSITINDKIDEFIENVIDSTESEDDINILTKIVTKSKSIILEKTFNIADEKEESLEKLKLVTVKIIKKDPEKAIEIINKNKQKKLIKDIIKTDVDLDDAINLDDIDEVYKENLSPN